MKSKCLLLLVSFISLVTAAISQNPPQKEQPDSKSEERIVREVRHELLMLAYFGVFDYIAFRVDGGNVTLLGEVVRPSLKSDAENVIKRIEGVERVVNQIDVLPPAPMDDQSRIQLFRAIYGYPALEKYALGVQKPIRIIVKNGRVTLEGVIDNEVDKNLVGLRANGVPGLLAVTNNLQVMPSK